MAKIGSSMTLPEPAKPLAMPVETATLVNITDVRLPIRMYTYGNYSIPFCVSGMQSMREVDGTVNSWPCKKGEEWAAMKIRAARGTIDFGEKQRSEFVITGREICLDIARESNSDMWGIGHDVTGEIGTETARGFAGIFLADGDEPTSAELAEMHELLRLSDEALIQEGHKTWDQFQKPDYIHEGFKRAARRSGVEADWLYTVSNAASLPDCPHCGSKMKSLTATVCATCHRDVGAKAPASAPKSKAAGKAKPHTEASGEAAA